jgi:hypothetical protein
VFYAEQHGATPLAAKSNTLQEAQADQQQLEIDRF